MQHEENKMIDFDEYTLAYADGLFHVLAVLIIWWVFRLIRSAWRNRTELRAVVCLKKWKSWEK